VTRPYEQPSWAPIAPSNLLFKVIRLKRMQLPLAMMEGSYHNEQSFLIGPLPAPSRSKVYRAGWTHVNAEGTGRPFEGHTPLFWVRSVVFVFVFLDLSQS
jgi:hypothetical protein